MKKLRCVRWIACVGAFSLVALLAACGATNAPVGSGIAAGLHAAKTPTSPHGMPSPTVIPLPYTFPKQWLPAPDSADLPAEIGSFIFAPSAPQRGYVCGVSTDFADDNASAPPAISATDDGGQTWQRISGPGSRFKTSCQVFIDQNDPSDIFAAAGKPDNQSSNPLPLFRSQDGRVTWKTINQPDLHMGASSFMVALAVVQSRIVAMVGLNGEGSVSNPLYTSDDGGQTWQPIHLAVNGKMLQISQQLWFDGPALVVEAAPSCSDGCGTLSAPTLRQPASRHLDQPLSSQPPSPNLYFTSADGGRTWAPFATPASNLTNLSFVRSADGSATYAIGTALGVAHQPAGVVVAFASKDGGGAWSQLPTLAGVENGYPDPASLGASGLYILPDGEIIATAFHTVGVNYSGDAGAFLLRSGYATPAWEPLIMPIGGSFWQTIPLHGGVRVWELELRSGAIGGQLIYFDLP